MLCVGLDLSLTSTGFCIDEHDADPSEDTQFMGAYTTSPAGRGEGALAARMVEIVCAVMDRLETDGRMPDLIVIENFAYKGYSTMDLARLYGILSAELLGLFQGNTALMDSRIVMVPPATLKRFFSGKGNADKRDMQDAAFRRFGRDIASHDAVDAFALWRLACCCLDSDLCRQTHEFEGVATVTGKDAEYLKEEAMERADRELRKLFED